MKNKYRFDPEKLNYDKVELNLWQKFLRFVVPQILAAIVIAFIIFFLVSYFFDTALESRLKDETKFLSENYSELDQKYDRVQKVLIDLENRDKNIYKAVFEAEPDSAFNAHFNVDIKKYLNYPADKMLDLSKLNKHKLDTIEFKIVRKEELYKDLFSLIRSNKKLLVAIPAIAPVKDPDFNFPVYGYGRHLDPVYKTPIFHKGIDFAIPIGTAVRATGNGVITRTGRKKRQYGKHIIVNHGNGYETLYANLNRILVHPGQRVKRGDIIALSGNSGKSVAPHLHYEVRKNGKAVDPANFIFLNLTPEQFDNFTFKATQAGQILD